MNEKNKGTKAMNIVIPIELHTMLKKISADTGFSIVQIIVKYLKYLRKYKYKLNKVVDEKSKYEFKLDADDSDAIS